MRVVLNRSLCDGNGLCAIEAPELFALGDNDELQVLREEFGPDMLDKVRRAVAACPKAALSIE